MIDVVDLVNIMGEAATTDLRGTRVLPYMLKVVGKPADFSEGGYSGSAT